MGWRIVKQPNGLLARFSEIVDDFCSMDMTEAEALDECRERMGRQEAKEKVRRGIDDCDPWSDKPGDGLSRWRECIEVITAVHGAERAAERIAVGESTP